MHHVRALGRIGGFWLGCQDLFGNLPVQVLASSRKMSGMQIDSESLYLMVGQLISVMPDFSGSGSNPLTAEQNAWLGRACALVEASRDITDAITIKRCADNITGPQGPDHVKAIAAILYRTLRADSDQVEPYPAARK